MLINVNINQFLKKISIIFFLLLGAISGWSYKSKTNCSAVELDLKNCPIRAHGYQLHFLDKKILIHNGVWRTIKKFPLIGENIEWKSIAVKNIGKDVYIQFLVWDSPLGEAQVQDLKWFVYKLKGQTLNKSLEKIVQKRSINNSKSSETLVKYDYDERYKFGLKLYKGLPTWFFRGKMGSLITKDIKSHKNSEESQGSNNHKDSKKHMLKSTENGDNSGV